MAVKTLDVISAILLAFVGGMYWGPWLALTRSIATFEPEVFLPVVKRLNRNMAPIMTVMMPLSLVSTVPVLVFTFRKHPETFYLTLAALILFAVTLFVTMLIEVPIVTSLDVETVSALPDDWQRRRDRWAAFHVLRVLPAIVGLTLLLIGAVSI
jgi:uncharacterized membrane protein